MTLRHQRMSREFEKFLFTHAGHGKKYFHSVFHHFTGRDRGNPHSHPWNFTSYILAGGYVERQYIIRPDGTWHSEIIHRLPETIHKVMTNTIHEIIELPEGECWTVVVPAGSAPIPWHFWRFDENGVYFRLPKSRHFKKYEP